MLFKSCALLLVAAALVLAQDQPSTASRDRQRVLANRRTKLIEDAQQQRATPAAVGTRRRLVAKSRVVKNETSTTITTTETTVTEPSLTDLAKKLNVSGEEVDLPSIEDEIEQAGEELLVLRRRPLIRTHGQQGGIQKEVTPRPQPNEASKEDSAEVQQPTRQLLLTNGRLRLIEKAQQQRATPVAVGTLRRFVVKPRTTEAPTTSTTSTIITTDGPVTKLASNDLKNTITVPVEEGVPMIEEEIQLIEEELPVSRLRPAVSIELASREDSGEVDQPSRKRLLPNRRIKLIQGTQQQKSTPVTVGTRRRLVAKSRVITTEAPTTTTTTTEAPVTEPAMIDLIESIKLRSDEDIDLPSIEDGLEQIDDDLLVFRPRPALRTQVQQEVVLVQQEDSRENSKEDHQSTRQRLLSNRRSKLIEVAQPQRATPVAVGMRRRLVAKSRVITTEAPTTTTTTATTTTEVPVTEPALNDLTEILNVLVDGEIDLASIEDEIEETDEELLVLRRRPEVTLRRRPAVRVQQNVRREDSGEVQQPVRQSRLRGSTRIRTQSNPQARPQTINRQQPTTRPINSQEDNSDEDRKPFVETTRRYSFVGDDGSFTFGYENADGSFKEETRNLDCTARGKYGYIDPEGIRREFTYQTGKQCDPNAVQNKVADEKAGLKVSVKRPITSERRPAVKRRPNQGRPVVQQEETLPVEKEREIEQVLNTPTRINRPVANNRTEQNVPAQLERTQTRKPSQVRASRTRSTTTTSTARPILQD